MRPFLLFAPYVLIPLALTLVWKRLGFKRTDWIYPFTVLIIFIYPFIVFWIDDLLNPPPPGPRCGNPQMGFILGNMLIFMPISLIIQAIFNRIFIKKTN